MCGRAYLPGSKVLCYAECLCRKWSEPDCTQPQKEKRNYPRRTGSLCHSSGKTYQAPIYEGRRQKAHYHTDANSFQSPQCGLRQQDSLIVTASPLLA
jgi:hypothetical protein